MLSLISYVSYKYKSKCQKMSFGLFLFFVFDCLVYGLYKVWGEEERVCSICKHPVRLLESVGVEEFLTKVVLDESLQSFHYELILICAEWVSN